MLYLELHPNLIEREINLVNGRMTQGNLTENEIVYCLQSAKEKALKLVSENQFYGSTIVVRSRFGRFPTRYKYKIQGVKAAFKYTKKGWGFVSCERTEDYPQNDLPRFTILWSKKATEKLQREAEKTYEQMLENSKAIVFFY